MSDDDKNGAWTANSGITLPEGEEATYNIGLSPFFLNRVGSNGYERALYGRGRSTAIFAKNIGTKGSRYSIDAQLVAVYPSRNDGGASIYASTLRCLVSTNNRIIINLVSDAPATEWGANGGISLPNNSNAIYNAGLSPFFYERNSGYVHTWSGTLFSYGTGAFLWSGNSKASSDAIFAGASYGGINPTSPTSRIFAFTLRCLVSTNNRIIIKQGMRVIIKSCFIIRADEAFSA